MREKKRRENKVREIKKSVGFLQKKRKCITLVGTIQKVIRITVYLIPLGKLITCR